MRNFMQKQHTRIPKKSIESDDHKILSLNQDEKFRQDDHFVDEGKLIYFDE